MKKVFFLILVYFTLSIAKDVVVPMENTVGYIEDNKGRKFLVVETEEGAKLVKVNKKPEKVVNRDLGITKEEMQIIGE